MYVCISETSFSIFIDWKNQSKSFIGFGLSSSAREYEVECDDVLYLFNLSRLPICEAINNFINKIVFIFPTKENMREKEEKKVSLNDMI